MKNFLPLISIALVLLSLTQVVKPPPANAAISSCDASVDPSSTTTISDTTFTFTVTNNGEETARWVKFTSPTGSLVVSSGSSSGWGVQNGGGEITFVDGQLSSGQSATFSLTITSGSEEMAAESWTVQVSDASNGSGATTCDGDTAIAISGQGTPVSILEITNVSVSNVAHSSVTISFDSGEDASSVIDYGTDEDYGTQATDASGTSHSIELTGLTANTTYHYMITITDSDSNTASTDNATFTTALSASATSTPGPTATPRVTTNTVTLPTPTPTPDVKTPVITINQIISKPYKDIPSVSGVANDNTAVANVEYTIDNGKSWTKIKSVKTLGNPVAEFSFIPEGLTDGIQKLKIRAKDSAGNTGTSNELLLTIDRTGPTVVLSTSIDAPFPSSPKITGVATDSSGESSVEYSLDGGGNWAPVDATHVRSATETEFSFTPPPLDDGNYDVVIRGIDPLGNITSPGFAKTLIIDRLPPRVGTALIFIGPQLLRPDVNAEITTVAHVRHTLTLSLVGGPTAASLKIINTKTLAEEMVSLLKHKESNLWTSSFDLNEAGTYSISVFAKDGANNQTEKLVTNLIVHDEGEIHSPTENSIPATITIYVLNEKSQTYDQWDGSPYGQNNPKRLEKDKSYSFIVPSGTYYMDVTSPGYQTIQTNSFTVTQTTTLEPSFTLKQGASLKVLFWNIHFPQLIRQYVTFQPNTTSMGNQPSQVTFAFPEKLELKNTSGELSQGILEGKQTILTFINTWIPGASAQIAALSTLKSMSPNLQIIAVFPHESASSIQLFQKRGGYDITMIADLDGDTLETYDAVFEPTHYLLDKNAQTTTKLTGIITADELAVVSSK